MPTEISCLRISRSFVTPTSNEATRELDFQLGARQGIAIHGVLGGMVSDPAGYTPAVGVQTEFTITQTLHLETGSLETVPDAAGEDEDTIDSEIFWRQDLWIGGNDDATTEFRASIASLVVPTGMVTFPRPIYSARNLTHRGIASSTQLDGLCHVILYYVFVEFSLAELGLILARRQ